MKTYAIIFILILTGNHLYSQQRLSSKVYFKSGKKTIEEEAKARLELEADQYAVMFQGKKEPATSTLIKLSKGNIRAPSHVTFDGRFPFPVTTYEERIDAIRKL